MYPGQINQASLTETEENRKKLITKRAHVFHCHSVCGVMLIHLKFVQYFSFTTSHDIQSL